MGQQGRAGGRYIIPINSSGDQLTNEGPRGAFTLASGQTYRYILGARHAPYFSVQLQGLDSALVITSTAIKDCNADERDIDDKNTDNGGWIVEDPATSFIAADGTGWTGNSPSSGSVAAAGSGVGGAMIHITGGAAARCLLEVVVGGTGGRLRVSSHSKD